MILLQNREWGAYLFLLDKRIGNTVTKKKWIGNNSLKGEEFPDLFLLLQGVPMLLFLNISPNATLSQLTDGECWGKLIRNNNIIEVPWKLI